MLKSHQKKCPRRAEERLFTTAALLCTLVFSACDRSDRQPGQQGSYQISDRSLDPGNPVPTNEKSLKLIADDPDLRRRSFHALMEDAHKQCNFVTEAVLKAGFEGTDIWRVTCADTHDWLVT